MLKITNLKFDITETFEDPKELLSKRLGVRDIFNVRLTKKSIDARNKNQIHFVCSFEFFSKNEDEIKKRCRGVVPAAENEVNLVLGSVGKKSGARPVVVGFGPAGMFAALTLCENGCPPIVIEQGEEVEKRTKSVDTFWAGGSLNESSNVQFGEGGAGTFSDGKLNTGTKSPYISAVLKMFYECGANEDILYNAKPHIGTDILQTVVKNFRKKIISLGGEIRFGTRLEDVDIAGGKIVGVKTLCGEEQDYIETDSVILAVGHSARATFEMLYRRGVAMQQKPFSVGVRIEHPQSLINRIQYGSDGLAKYLGAADYKLAVHLQNGRSLYSFCMCPGGYVVAAASESGMVVTNGMSKQKRDNLNANSALLVGINPSDFGDDSPLAGITLQRSLEKKAFEVGGGNYFAPVMMLGDLMNQRESKTTEDVAPTYNPGVTSCDFREIFPKYIMESLKGGILEMDKKMPGFLMSGALLTAVESRSSSPLRIWREDNGQSSVTGVYPCGEGSGYAGGIISSAVDGIKSAMKFLMN